jgi:hypothetical protein
MEDSVDFTVFALAYPISHQLITLFARRFINQLRSVEIHYPSDIL